MAMSHDRGFNGSISGMQLAWRACVLGLLGRYSAGQDNDPISIRRVVAALRRVAVKLRQIQEQLTGLAFVVLGMYGNAID
ncbi:MAG: hypothetical protein DI640_11540 [Sphingomonas taxi]|uniref:Uncharacterized protein n=1 Tax=Sphingomonas taxi TaxID=1549858 RepID=A0A2W4YWY2_9SPHN|nr:MAG: hypothetical protein DI640_11540 [Sphingomonas taxi]